jgi:hypothetical protein
MPSISPTNIFSGYTATATDITIPLVALPGLTTAEAHATTGDGRELLRIILEKYFSAIEGMQAANRPVSMQISRGNLVGLSANMIRRSYSISFDESVGATATSIKAEP